MAKSQVAASQDYISNDNSQSASTKEFLKFEKTIEAYKDTDEEIKLIFSEITKLSAGNRRDDVIDASVEDVELILKRAEDIAQETQNLLRSSPVSAVGLRDQKTSSVAVISEVPSTIPQIKVTKADENKGNEVMTPATTVNTKVSPQHKIKTANDLRRKTKARPFSAGLVEVKKRETAQEKVITNAQKRSPNKQDALIEELKDTAERAASLELLNVQLTEDNKALRKQVDQLSEQKHIADLKLAECEKFISRIAKQYEERNQELKATQGKESQLLAELNKERNERKNLTIRHDKDASVIQDLQRQVKEMEMILRRKHPDSVSALIVASKSSTLEDNKKKLLEDRISRLEQELKDKESHFQGVLLTLQEKFGDMKQKYENHIVDVEKQLMEERKHNMELKDKITRANITDAAVQTVPKVQQNFSTQTVAKPDRASSATATSRLSQNSALLLNKLKEDSYLIATIKGLQTELTAKQRTIAKINRETEELKKNLRNLQKEKEVLLNLNPQKKIAAKQAKSSENIIARLNSEMEAEVAEARKQRDEFVMERKSLLESLKRSNEELIILKKKRIQDLHTLQLAHEQELMQMNMQLYPLQEEIKLLNRTVEILQDRVRATEDKLLRYQGCIKDVDMNGGGDNPSSRSSYKNNYNSYHR